MSSPSQSASSARAVARFSIAVSSAFLAACASSEAAEPPKNADARPRVTVTTPLRGPTVVHVLGAGPLAAKRETDLAFKLGGVVANVAVEEGASVKRGQVLATLAAADVDAQAAVAAAGLAKAERDFTHVDVLYNKETVPRATWEDAASARDVARAQLRAVRDAQGRSVLVAPDDGYVTKRYVERGAVIAAGFPAFHLQGAEKGFVVRMAIADRDALAAVPGSPASVTFPALPGKRFVGVVGEKPRASAPGTGAFELEVFLAPENRELPSLSGLSAEVDVSVPIQAAASVPMGALVGENRDHAAIFLVDAKNTVRRTPVVVARVVDGVALLAERLPDGDVVLAGAESLVDGEEVVVKRESTSNSHGDSR
jgi:RND family efflux transporter MFP subunit